MNFVALFGALIFLGDPSIQAAPNAIGKVVDSYIEGTTTQMLIEATRILNTSQTVYLHGGIALTVKEVLSIRETEGVYYYKAYIPEKVRVLSGENIFFEITKKEEKLKRFEKEAIFMKKKFATVTLVDEEKVLVNRGSLHNVDKRDVYKVFDSSGQSRGEIELYGIGDFLSAGKLRYPIEHGGKRQEVREGEQAVFVGNRKILGLGMLLPAGYHIDGTTGLSGGKNLWSVPFRSGWACEFHLGSFSREVILSENEKIVSFFNSSLIIKKYFFYPGPVSPFFSTGL